MDDGDLEASNSDGEIKVVAKSGSENEFDVRIETASAESIIESSTRD